MYYIHGIILKVYCHSKALKVFEIYTNKYSVCNFLLAFHCNYVSILYHF